MTRVRFAPSPTGSLLVGNALCAVANRRFGDWMLLRIDDTDAARNVPGGEEAITEDLTWLGIAWDDGPVRQSSRGARHMEAARAAGLPQRFEGIMLWRDDDSPTFHLASVVDDIDFGITHDVHLDLERIRSLSVDVLAQLSDEELAERAGVPPEAAALMRGAHDLVEARALARSVLDPPSNSLLLSPETLERFVELRSSLPE